MERVAIPSTKDAFAFFAKYRQQVEEKERNEGEAVQLEVREKRSILTQASELQTSGDSANDITAESIIPVDLTKGTPSFRLRTLKLSPKNCSPDLLNPLSRVLLPPPLLNRRRRITLVLDVDETLVHSTLSPKAGVRYDTQLQIVHNQQTYTIYVIYRPYLHDFLNFVSERFEVVIFTASVSSYCNPLMDELDKEGKLGTLRLFREHCTLRQQSYIKDLFLLGRDLGRVVIVDNSPTAYLFQQRNAIPIKSWFGDPTDLELPNMYTLLAKLSTCDSVYDLLDKYNATGAV